MSSVVRQLLETMKVPLCQAPGVVTLHQARPSLAKTVRPVPILGVSVILQTTQNRPHALTILKCVLLAAQLVR